MTNLLNLKTFLPDVFIVGHDLRTVVLNEEGKRRNVSRLFRDFTRRRKFPDTVAKHSGWKW